MSQSISEEERLTQRAFTRWMVCIDGSDPCGDAVKWMVKEISHQKYPQLNRVCVIHAIPSLSADLLGATEVSLTKEYQEGKKEITSALLSFQNIFQQIGAEAYVKIVEDCDSPEQAILKQAEVEKIDHIVLGSTGKRLVSRMMLGSVSDAVVKGASCAVTVIKHYPVARSST